MSKQSEALCVQPIALAVLEPRMVSEIKHHREEIETAIRWIESDIKELKEGLVRDAGGRLSGAIRVFTQHGVIIDTAIAAHNATTYTHQLVKDALSMAKEGDKP